MVKKKIVYSVVILIVAVILIFVIVKIINKPVVPSGKITAFFHLYSSPAKEELEKLLVDFSHKYEEVDLVYQIEPYLNLKRSRTDFLKKTELASDHVVVSSMIASDISEKMKISPGTWTGTEWKLFYNSEVMKKLGISEEKLELMAEPGLESFVNEISTMLEKDQLLFSVSSRYYIQWLSWLQHIELEQHSGKMPKSFSLKEWQSSIDIFYQLVDYGSINQDHREINTATTAIRMFKGEVLFTLYTDEIYSIFLPGDRFKIESLSFPGSSRQGWFVGSGFYLAIIPPSKVTRGAEAAAEKLIEYLRSSAVIDQMRQNVGVELNPVRKRERLDEIPSITVRVRDKELQEIIDTVRH